MAYLDNTGLAYFWGKIKAWANSVFALLGHTHPSSDVTLMTGYSMPASSGAISSGDTLNQAVGKLEKAITDADISNAVHRTGDEAVAGLKSFSGKEISNVPSGTSTTSALAVVMPNYVKGDAIADSSAHHTDIFFMDSSGGDGTNWAGRLASIEHTIQKIEGNNNSHILRLTCFKNDPAITEANYTSYTDPYVSLLVGYDSSGIPCAIAPSTSENRASGGDILTRDWIPKDDRIVHTTGAETIAGSKTFTNNVTIAPASGPAQVVLTSDANNDSIKRCVWLRNDGADFWIIHSDAGDTSVWNNIRTHYSFSGKQWVTEDSNLVFFNRTFKASTGCPDTANGLNIRNFDNAGNATHAIIFRRETNGTTRLYLRAQEPLNPANYSDLTVLIDENGYKYATAPTPDATANNVEIATAAWVRTFCDTTQKYMKAVSVTGSGNAVTAASLSNGTLTLTKGSTFLTSHQSLSNYVTLNSAQTITGNKTFTGPIVISENSMRIDATSNKYIYTKFTNLSSNTSHASSSLALQVGIQANNGSFIVRTYYEVQSSGDVRTMFAHDHTSSQSQFVFYSYSGKAEGYVTCSVDNKYRLGIANHRWSAVWAATATIQTSDERMKVDVAPVPDEVLDVWEDVEWRQFKFTDSVEEKGLDGARLHTGAVAQSIGRAFAAAGLDASRYGFYCYDSWDAKPASYDETGRMTDAGEEAGDRYSLRYEEALCIEAAYMRRENARLKKRVADLEERLAALELRLGSE